jgi:plasmid stabilization system protein ParE
VRIRFSSEARADLRDIAKWIGGDNFQRAQSFSAELRAACSTLAAHPARFPVVDQVDGHAVRKRVHGSYLIFYRVMATEVEIIGILHGARDWIASLEERRK